MAPLDPLQRVGGPGAVAYKGSREPLLDSLPVTRGGLGDSPRHANGSRDGSPKLNFGGSPGLTFGLGDGSKKGSPAASKAGSPYLAQQPSTPPATARLPASKRDFEDGKTKRVRAYELHNSSNAFALGGRLITGGDASPLPMLLTFVLEVGLSAAWIGTTGVGLWRHGVSGNGDNGGIAVVVVFLWLWGISFGAMIATVRALRPQSLPHCRDIRLTACSGFSYRPSVTLEFSLGTWTRLLPWRPPGRLIRLCPCPES